MGSRYSLNLTAAGDVRINMRHSNGDTFATGTIASAADYTLGQWNHILCTVSSLRRLRVAYCNNVQTQFNDTINPGASGFDTQTVDLSLGGNGDGLSSPFDGALGPFWTRLAYYDITDSKVRQYWIDQFDSTGIPLENSGIIASGDRADLYYHLRGTRPAERFGQGTYTNASNLRFLPLRNLAIGGTVPEVS